MKSLKIIHFGRFYSKSVTGGVQHFVDVLIDSTKKKHTIHNLVASPDNKTHFHKEDGFEVIEAASLGVVKSTAMSPKLVQLFFSLFKKNKYDVVHMHFPDPLSLLVGLMMPKSIPIVVTWHSDVLRQKKLLFLYLPFLKYFMNKKVSAVTVATPKHLESCRQLELYRRDDKKFVVPFYIDPERVSLDQQTLLEVQETKARNYSGKVVLFSLGRHIYYKGYEYLVQAMKDVDDAVLLLGGSGPLTEKLKQMVKDLGVEDKVKFLGRVPEEELGHYFNLCDIFCFPSVDQTEAFGFVQAEAMICGKPVVGTHLGNGVNYVNQHGKTGICVKPRDSKELSQAINQLVQNMDQRKQMGDAAKNWILEQYSEQAMVSAIDRVYSEVTQ